MSDGTSIIALLLAAFGFGLFAGWLLPNHRGKFQAEAVEVGHAEYYLDENHDRQWRWIDTAEAAQLKDQDDE